MEVTNDKGYSFQIDRTLTDYAQSRQEGLRNLPSLPKEWVVLEVTKMGAFITYLLFDIHKQGPIQDLGGLDKAYSTLDFHKLNKKFSKEYLEEEV